MPTRQHAKKIIRKNEKGKITDDKISCFVVLLHIFCDIFVVFGVFMGRKLYKAGHSAFAPLNSVTSQVPHPFRQRKILISQGQPVGQMTN